jgi:hypothetical protein
MKWTETLQAMKEIPAQLNALTMTMVLTAFLSVVALILGLVAVRHAN